EDPDDASFSGEGFGGRESETAAGAEPRHEGFDGRWTYPDDADEPQGPNDDDDEGSVWVRWAPDPDADPDGTSAPASASAESQTTRPALDEIADRVLDGRV